MKLRNWKLAVAGLALLFSTTSGLNAQDNKPQKQRPNIGAFGSDSAKREELPPVAVARAEERHGHRFAGEDVVIIGYSIYDVRCGVPHGATTIAVASGKTPAEIPHPWRAPLPNTRATRSRPRRKWR